MSSRDGEDKDSNVSIESRHDGLYVKHGDLEDGPYKSVYDIHPPTVAQKLGVMPGDVAWATIRYWNAFGSPRNTVETREVAKEISDTFAYTGDRPFQGRIQVVALGSPQSRYMRLTFRCKYTEKECPGCILSSGVTLAFNEPEMDPSAFAAYFDTNNPEDALKVLVERRLKLGCLRIWKEVDWKGKNERAVTPAVVMDRQGVEGRAWFVHGERCDLKRAPNWIIAEGWLCRGRYGRIGVLVFAFTSESEVSSPRPEDVEAARKYLRGLVDESSNDLENSVVWKIAGALQCRSQLKGSEIVRGYVSDLLTVAGRVWVQTPQGPKQLGPTTCEVGPTTTAKSLRTRTLVLWLGCGKYERGRKTAAGLTAGVEKIEGIGFVVKKGLLPSMDLSFLILDNMPPHALDDQIESRKDGIISVTAIRNAELWARCRLKLLNNPLSPIDERMYKCTALKMFDSKFVSRFAFALFTYGASAEERYDSKIMEAEPEDDRLLDAARTVLRWNLSRETTYVVPEKLWPTIMEKGKELELKYGCEDIPLLLRANPYKLACVAYAFALLEGYEEPEERHVRLAYQWLDLCAKDIELDKYVEWWRGQHELNEAGTTL